MTPAPSRKKRRAIWRAMRQSMPGWHVAKKPGEGDHGVRTIAWRKLWATHGVVPVRAGMAR